MTNPGTWRNSERAGRRVVTRLSKVARRVENVRHVDIDLKQYCPSCKRPQLFAESKRTLVNDHEWQQVRLEASYWGHGCMGLLVIEPAQGDTIGVKVFDSRTQEITPVQWADEDFLVFLMERARDRHECW